MKRKIEINQSLCIGCGLCKEDCVTCNIVINNRKAILKSQDCIQCGHCVIVCPKQAISIEGLDSETINPSFNGLDSEDLLMAIKTRRSVRKFKNQEVKQEDILKIIEAGRWTPTAENQQDVSYIVLKDNLDKVEKVALRVLRRILPIAKLVSPVARKAIIDDHFFFKGAPIVIVVEAKEEVNGALAATSMELMAESLGLGVLYSGFFAVAVKYSLQLKKMLSVSSHKKVVTALVIGYPDIKYQKIAPKEKANIKFY